MVEGGTSEAEWAILEFLGDYGAVTQKHYRQNLEQFMSWLTAEGVGLFDVKEPGLERYLEYLRTERRSQESTIRHKQSTLAQFYKFAEVTGRVNASPMEYLVLPPLQREVTTETLTQTELLACLEVARREGIQPLLLWRLLAIHGLRVGEVVDLDVTDVEIHENGVVLRFFNRGTQEADHRILDDETSSLATRVVDGRSTGPLLRLTKGASKGHRMDRRGAARIITAVAKRAGVEKRLTPRSLRATCLILELQSGKSMTDVQRAFGISDRRNFRAYKKRALST